MEPLRQLLRQQLVCAGEAWEEDQRHRVLTGQSGDGRFGDRDYRLGIAARGEDEARFFAQLRALLFTGEMWEVLPAECHTMAFRSLVFRLLSRAGCAVHELMARPHRQFPNKLFRLLSPQPGEAAALREEPPCLMDGWSKRMRGAHPTFEGGGLCSRVVFRGAPRLERHQWRRSPTCHCPAASEDRILADQAAGAQRLERQLLPSPGEEALSEASGLACHICGGKTEGAPRSSHATILEHAQRSDVRRN